MRYAAFLRYSSRAPLQGLARREESSIVRAPAL